MGDDRIGNLKKLLRGTTLRVGAADPAPPNQCCKTNRIRFAASFRLILSYDAGLPFLGDFPLRWVTHLGDPPLPTNGKWQTFDSQEIVRLTGCIPKAHSYLRPGS